MAILIKRYANRKLYNTETSRYITLKGIARLLSAGEEIRVIDNRTGEDIAQVALSQILVDNQRANEDPSDTLLSQILSKGGDALYGAIRRSVDDATEGIGEFQDRFRRIVSQAEPGTRRGPGFRWDTRSDAQDDDYDDDDVAEDDFDDDAGAHPPDLTPPRADLESVVRLALENALDSVDLPNRRDIQRLNENLERLTRAVERMAASEAGEDADR